ncbi:hypothetical protein [Aliiroseovarius sp. F20344]|uniref:hypothetical protein n=1 Tax=Aliiroseovarius sp. F20344 TaxID=2926414 RepID=UPI001FF53A20|nr:hypothetical protein [Aliiroseovarius sp. F20344]MCK0142536.1 hypothetical protein [Aliiroseovarius sp. F20344]
MFAPEGYISFGLMSEFISDWVHRIYLAKLLQEDEEDLEGVFDFDMHPDSLLGSFKLKQFRKLHPDYPFEATNEEMQEYFDYSQNMRFDISVLYHCLLSRVLKDFPTCVSSSEGLVIQPDESLFLHMDRLDWVHPVWPIRKSRELLNIFKLYEEGSFDTGDLAARYCFLDHTLGCIRLKNNSASGFERSSHYLDSETTRKYIEQQVTPFVSWVLVWKRGALPDDFPTYLQQVGFIEPGWGLVGRSEGHERRSRPTERRGPKPSGAKEEYYRRYPHGKPKEVSFLSISKELEEAGFKISERMVGNYEKQRNE